VVVGVIWVVGVVESAVCDDCKVEGLVFVSVNITSAGFVMQWHGGQLN